MAGSGAGSRICRQAMRTARRSTNRRFLGGRRHRSHTPLTPEQEAYCAHLRKLAPKPKRKRSLRGPF